MRDRDHLVLGTPQHGHRHGLAEVGAVGHGHDLTAPVDDGSHQVADREPGAPVLPGLDDVGDLVEVAGVLAQRPDAAVRGGGAQRLRLEVPKARQGEQADDPEPARHLDELDERRDLGSQAPGGHQHEPLGALGELVGELHRDPAAEAVAHDGHLVDAEDRQQVAHPVGVAAEGVVGARLVGQPVTEQVRRDDGVALGQVVDDGGPGRVVAGQAVQQQYGGAGSPLDVGTALAVQRDVLDVVRPDHRTP